MNTTILLLILFVVAVLIGPFATLRAVAYFRQRRLPPSVKPQPYRDEDEDS
ncbi:hypothetical protein SAMN04488038_11480 [Solimonas aquatica]|uniref:Uncharacterized protein n=1 Tax=Solimonas aquatica TaxID=489703 RepID=A0A1H9KX02_9GAMM|nr:hypothetical protein [Solimonas aquatica]SER03714.1 hypothetical protein SAMN04488038_11480 [Solimonas aquatica]